MQFTSEELSCALDLTASAILDEAMIRREPVDTLLLAKRLNFLVTTDDRQVSRARFVRFSNERDQQGEGSIFVRSDPRPERLQWAVAHEIGKARAEQVFAALAVQPVEVSNTMREQIANQLANRLLLPTDWFRQRAIRCKWDLLTLKQKFCTASHELIARRMLDFEPPIVITIVDNGVITLRQSNVSGQVPPATTEERACWQATRATGDRQQADSSLGSVQAWPVHESGWQREIVRCELNLCECCD